jgi:hypothetical protein
MRHRYCRIAWKEMVRSLIGPGTPHSVPVDYSNHLSKINGSSTDHDVFGFTGLLIRKQFSFHSHKSITAGRILTFEVSN